MPDLAQGFRDRLHVFGHLELFLPISPQFELKLESSRNGKLAIRAKSGKYCPT